MYKFIVLSSCLFGSVYLYGKSLKLINNLFLQNKKIPKHLMIINGLTFVIFGSVVVCSFYLSYFK